MNSITRIVIGIVLMALPVCIAINFGWLDSILVFLRNILAIAVFLIGIIFFFIGISDLKTGQ